MKTFSKLLLVLFLGIAVWACKKDDDDNTPIPTITSVSPTSAAVGADVTITGTNFSTTPTSNIVKFNNVDATVKSATATQIVATVPMNATTGKVTVAVGGRTATSPNDFTVGPTVKPVVEVPAGNISASTTWSAANTYLLKGFVYVPDGITLTIEPGTIIKGDAGTKGTLIIKQGGKINAVGTVDKPIVFTSNQPKGSRNYGDWGGVIILGRAPVNKANPVVEGENVSPFGGAIADDNSGTLKYVRIEFAGIAFETDKEINGLTLGGVGSGTTLDYIQVSYSGDDAFEWFGGTVNAKHLISYRTLDDDFDTDFGYSGNVQYGYVLRDPAIADQCTCSDSNGFESDNDGQGTEDNPKTKAKFANISIIMGQGTPDAKYRSGARIRRSSEISIFNSVFVGPFPRTGLELQDVSATNYTAGKMNFQGLVISGFTTPLTGVDATKFNDAANANNTALTIAELMLDASYNTLTAAPSLLPKAGSPLLTGGVTLPTGFEATTFKGAFGTTNWSEGWTNWDPQNTDY